MKGHFTWAFTHASLSPGTFPCAVLQLYCDQLCENKFVLEEACFLNLFLKNYCQNGSPNLWKAELKGGLELLALPYKRLSDSMPKILSFLAGLDLDVSDQNLHSYYFLGTYTSLHLYKMDTMIFIMWRLCLNRILNLQFFVAKDYFLELKSVISIININISLIYCMVFLYLQSNIHKTKTKSLC